KPDLPPAAAAILLKALSQTFGKCAALKRVSRSAGSSCAAFASKAALMYGSPHLPKVWDRALSRPAAAAGGKAGFNCDRSRRNASSWDSIVIRVFAREITA